MKEAVPLAINFDKDRGDKLAIIRKDFPERSDSSLTPEQRGALKDYRAKILEAFQTGDYVAGLEWAAKGLKVAVKRSDKIFILKMKGSLHFRNCRKNFFPKTFLRQYRSLQVFLVFPEKAHLEGSAQK